MWSWLAPRRIASRSISKVSGLRSNLGIGEAISLAPRKRHALLHAPARFFKTPAVKPSKLRSFIVSQLELERGELSAIEAEVSRNAARHTATALSPEPASITRGCLHK
jgi:hypothetical protein